MRRNGVIVGSREKGRRGCKRARLFPSFPLDFCLEASANMGQPYFSMGGKGGVEVSVSFGFSGIRPAA